jgi:cytoskeletal protein CcmA (bactofilin family)
MRKEFGQIEGEVHLTDDLALYGMCVGDIVVESGGCLHLYGMCAGNVDVKPGAVVVVYGMCTGTVTNSGGKLEISGMIVGHLVKDGGTTTVLPTARVSVEP